MRRRHLLAALPLLPLAARAQDRPRIVASFSILGDMVRQIAGGLAEVDVLVGPDQDVHVYEPRPKDLRTLLAARLLVRNGLGLEGWMDRLTGAAGFKGLVIDAAARVVPRTMSDAGALATDPHAWQDPRNALLYVRAITAGLTAADPANAAAYQRQADRYAEQIAATDAWIADRFAAIPPDRRRVLTTHDAFGYYAARYGIQFLSAEGISTETEPSAKQIAALVAQIKRDRVRAVFIENMTSDRIAKMLARETGAKLGGTVYPDALSAPGGSAPTYLEMLRTNTRLFAAAMGAA
jgi:zinc/manganese transport system substrate-binding protein